ncbi:MAG: metalloregulator ArsR/SmtB family transcription factor [Gammaproteobacteria bacterium]|nr:metalloregulator ArsR/SmtB family transcription factor [Gammaproteobacteria bacterium]
MNLETQQLMAQFKALADPVRLRLIALCGHGECSVSELTRVLALSQPRVSQHLKTLCDASLLERFRDGQFVYYRVPARGEAGVARRRLVELLPLNEPTFADDIERLRSLRGGVSVDAAAAEDRALHRALIELTVAAPLGDIIDIGCGHGRILKLLASRAKRAVGVDIDADARRFARAELLLAGLPHCTLRKGDMYALPFADKEFDTVILDDVLGDADRPVAAIEEAARLLRPGGRLLLLATANRNDVRGISANLAAWCRSTGLRLSSPRSVPVKNPSWVLAVATPAESSRSAA